MILGTNANVAQGVIISSLLVISNAMWSVWSGTTPVVAFTLAKTVVNPLMYMTFVRVLRKHLVRVLTCQHNQSAVRKNC